MYIDNGVQLDAKFEFFEINIDRTILRTITHRHYESHTRGCTI